MRPCSMFSWVAWLTLWGVGAEDALKAELIADLTSQYHHIQVVDENGFRLLSFDGSMESRISLANPLEGHFEYTGYFHLAWLWNTQMSRVLIVGLGGGTTQRAFAHYYPELTIETSELDPMVVNVARQFFQFRESDRQRVHVTDGRLFLRRTREPYDLIIMDAYSRHRYGSYVPHHLVTREFCALASERLSTNGVLCYNLIGSWQGPNSALTAAVYQTLNAVFPHVYVFPVTDSQNTILLASKSPRKLGFNELQERATILVHQKRIRMPGFRDRLYTMRTIPPPGARTAPVLTDDFAPIQTLVQPGSIGDQEVDSSVP